LEQGCGLHSNTEEWASTAWARDGDLLSTPNPGWRRTFIALENRNFRWMWLAGLVSSAAFQMGIVARGWLVYDITGSALALGWVSSGWAISILTLSLFGGVVADRVRKRNVLVISQIAMGMVTLVIGLLIAADLIQVWHLFVGSAAAGIIFAFQMPANDSFIAEIVDQKTLLNASSLSSVAMSLMGIVGAPAAGVLLDRLGAEAVYFLQVPLYILIAFFLLRLPLTPPSDRQRGSVLTELREGLCYVQSRAMVVILLAMSLSRVLLAMPYQTFLPVFAEDVFGMGASGLGLLQSAVGAGAMVASLWVASLGDFRRKGGLLLAAGLVLGGGLLLFARAPTFRLALGALVLVGAAGNVCMVANFTLLQTTVSDRVRGRVLSMAMWLWGFSPVGTVPSGALADRWGAPLAVALQGGLLLLFFAFVGVAQPRFRALE
jgi:MFS family permease